LVQKQALLLLELVGAYMARIFIGGFFGHSTSMRRAQLGIRTFVERGFILIVFLLLIMATPPEWR
jgi:hypothetical protein